MKKAAIPATSANMDTNKRGRRGITIEANLNK
jgi:hypothetical protein